MPYRNEHSARIHDPGKYDSFRRENNKFKDGIHAIWGIKSGKSELQAVRFDAKKYTVTQAKKWLKDNDISYISFEPAKKEEKMLTKSLSAEVKDMDKGLVKFQFSKFDHVDTDMDITRKGAFERTMRENIKRIKHFKNHRLDQSPGVIKELYENTDGAFAISQLILDSTLGKDTYAEYKAGAITEHSYGYDIIKSNQIEVDGKQVQELKELRLREVSSLTAWGASEYTPTLDVKMMFEDKDEQQIMDYLEGLEQLKKGDFSDEYFEKLNNRIAAVSEFLDTLVAPSGTTGPPDTDTEPLIEAMKHSMIFNRANHGRKGTKKVY